MKTPTPTTHPVHVFHSTAEAYDACQCDEGIKKGDLLHIPSEQVVGVAFAWPLAVTEAYGVLHALDPTSGVIDQIALAALINELPTIPEAIALAISLGYPVTPQLAHLAS